ncbi:MAG: NAD(P)H-dependent oxidoreductase [Henriciella sp.]
MKKALIINGHQPFPSSPGRLNARYADLAATALKARSFEVRTVASADPWNIDDQVENQLWADLIFVQFPLNSMSVPWSLKRYLDEVYTAGMDGRLAKGDGRTRSDQSKQYGSGGMMGGKTYALSVTLNAPESAFSDPAQTLFAGRSLDQLLAPIHINFAFFGLQSQTTFAAYDVTKNPQTERDFARFKSHIAAFDL